MNYKINCKIFKLTLTVRVLWRNIICVGKKLLRKRSSLERGYSNSFGVYITKRCHPQCALPIRQDPNPRSTQAANKIKHRSARTITRNSRIKRLFTIDRVLSLLEESDHQSPRLINKCFSLLRNSKDCNCDLNKYINSTTMK